MVTATASEAYAPGCTCPPYLLAEAGSHAPECPFPQGLLQDRHCSCPAAALVHQDGCPTKGRQLLPQRSGELFRAQMRGVTKELSRAEKLEALALEGSTQECECDVVAVLGANQSGPVGACFACRCAEALKT